MCVSDHAVDGSLPEAFYYFTVFKEFRSVCCVGELVVARQLVIVCIGTRLKRWHVAQMLCLRRDLLLRSASKCLFLWVVMLSVFDMHVCVC
jgi:hypothetical protein